jgi:predicted permease
LRDGLVSLQLGLALVLGVGASVLLHSFIRVQAVDPGFSPEGLVQFTLSAKRPGVEGPTWAAWDEILEGLSGVRGATSVAATSNLPFEDPNWAPWLRFPGETPAEAREGIAGYVVTPGYFESLGQPLLAGRSFLATDGPTAERVAIVNQALMDRDFDGVAPLDRVIHLGGQDDEPPVRVVGVVGNTVLRRAEEGPLPAVYVPYTQEDWPWAKIVVRTDRTDPELYQDLRRAAAAVSPVVPIQAVDRVTDRIRRVEAEPRFHAILVGVFALAALLLAAAGLYASLAHAVGRRTREMGIRMALGAEPGRVFGLVVRYGAGLAAVGGMLGLAGAVALAGVLETFLFGVPALDPVGVAVAAGTLAAVVGLATLRPALRAARVDVVRSITAE